MTSPAISKSPENQKSEKKSPAHSVTSAEKSAEPSSSSSAGTGADSQPESFSWLRIFKLADLMMKQGC